MTSEIKNGVYITARWPGALDGRLRLRVNGVRSQDMSVRPGHVKAYLLGAGTYQIPLCDVLEVES